MANDSEGDSPGVAGLQVNTDDNMEIASSGSMSSGSSSLSSGSSSLSPVIPTRPPALLQTSPTTSISVSELLKL